MTLFRQTFLLLLFLMSALGGGELFAQTRGFNYQAVARNNDGSLLANQAVNVRFFIRQSTAAGVAVYEETHAPTTNAYGLFSLEIGAGTVVSGTLDAIQWASDRYFLEVQLNGVSAGASELIEVPYAKVATDMALSDLKDVGAGAPANGQTLKWNGAEWAPANDDTGSGSQWTTAGSDIHFNTGNVGIGDATPAATLTVGDGDKFQVQGATGNVIFTDPNASIRFPATTGTNAPMMFQFASGTQNRHRMVVAHSPNFPNWGIQYQDTSDLYNFLASGTPVLTVHLGNQRVGVGQENPLGKLHVKFNSSSTVPHLLLEEDATNDYARLQFQNLSGASNWQIAGLNSATAGEARLNLFHSVVGNILSLTDNKRVGFSTLNPTHNIHLIHSNGAGSTNSSQGLKLQNEGGNNHSWTLYTVNNGGELWIYSGITNVGRFAVTGTYTVISDERRKTAIRPMASTLDKVMQLSPMTYRYKHQEANAPLSLGFLAQSVAPLFPELVNHSAGDNGEASYTMDYSGFSVVAIKAVQEQQAVIEKQQQLIEALTRRIEALEQQK